MFSFFRGIQFRLYLIIALTTLVSSLVVFFIVYSTFYDKMLLDARNKAIVANEYAQRVVPLESFMYLATPADVGSPIYQKTQAILNEIRTIGKIRYLYTAKRDPSGTPVYIIDGLDLDSSDFRGIGAAIEPEIITPLNACFDGDKVDVSDILKTSWGPIFFSCRPMKDADGHVEGAIVMEFDAENLAALNTQNKLYTFGVSVVVIIVSLLLSTAALKNMLLNPLLEIRQAVSTLPTDGFTARVSENASTKEVRSLQVAFNQMANEASENIRKIKDAEQARYDAEGASEAKSAFLANMSHEVRTPMNGVLGMLYLVLQGELAPAQRQYLVKADKSAKLLLGVLNDILDFSSIEANKLSLETAPLQLKMLFDDAIALVQHASRTSGVRINATIDTTIPEVLMGDELRISQVLNNLLANAVKFTPKGEVNASIALATLEGRVATVRIRVADTGIGMTEKQLNDLFQAFSQADVSSTRKYGGTGLGLAITRRLLDMMDGTIHVESEPDKGSVFTCTLPLLLPDPNVHPLPDSSRHSASASFENKAAAPRVLLVEDNEINQMVVSDMLERKGYRIDVAGDGQEALDRLDLNAYDIVLMDVQMPVMDGLTATRLIRQNSRFARLPVIAMTAHAMEGDREKSLAAGMQAHVTKPIDPEKLFATLLFWLTAWSASSSTESLPNSDAQQPTA